MTSIIRRVMVSGSNPLTLWIVLLSTFVCVYELITKTALNVECFSAYRRIQKCYNR